MERARRSPRTVVRRFLPVAVAIAVALPLCLPSLGGVATAAPRAAELQERLRRLNGEADQAVEEYLEAQLGLKQTRASLTDLRRQLGAAKRQLDQLRAGVAAQAADAYRLGPSSLALVLDPGTADDALDRMQTLNLLAERTSDQFADLRVAEQAFQTELERLAKVERDRKAQVDRLARNKRKVEGLVARTEGLLNELRRSAGGAAVNGVDPGLPAGAAPPLPSGAVSAVVRYAYAQVGKPYSFGAAGPGAFDCSGLTMMAWAQAGVGLPHSSAGQYGIGRHVSRSELRPGDLIFRNSPISHVAMYVGNGMQVAATHTGSTVKLQSAFQGNIVGYSRPSG